MIDTRSGPRRVAEHWWVLLLRGVIAILFGLFAFAFPLSTAAAFVLVFGAYVFVDGVFALVAAVRWHHPETARWWYTIAHAVFGIAVGIVTFIDPSITGAALGVLIAIWAIVTGIAEIATGLRMRANIPGEIFLIVAGVASILLGILFLGYALLPLLFLAYAIAAYAIVAGISLVTIGLRLRGIHTSGGKGLRV